MERPTLETWTFKLNLLANGTYAFEGKIIVELGESEIWQTLGIDRNFKFYDNNENLIQFASPFGGNGKEKTNFNLYDSNEVRFIKENKYKPA
jgi:hypothetical protein